MKIKKEWAIMLSVLPVTFMNTLDSSIVNVALPTMAKDLGTTMAGIEWVVTSYLITICAAILLFGRFGDIIGKNKVFKFGILVFTIGSLLCGISGNLGMLIIARIIQAIGASATMATNQGIITETFPAKERGKALGMIATAVALGTMAGPTLGGFIVTVAPWEYIFLINIPIGIIVYLIGIKNLKVDTKKINIKFDYLGTISYIIATVLLFTSINLTQQLGGKNPIIIGGFLISIILYIVFIRTEIKVQAPMLDLRIFKNKLFSLSIFCAFTCFVCLGSVNIILPFYFQDILKLTPSGAGLMMTIAPILLAICGPLSGHLSDKKGSEKISFIGVLIFTLGMFALAIFGENTSLLMVGIIVGIISIGNAIFQSPNNSLIMSTVDKEKLGIAGSVNGLVRNIGNTTGIALSTGVLYSLMSSKIGYKVSGYVEGREDVFIYAMRIVFIGLGAVCLIGAILSLGRLVTKKKSS